MLKSPLLPLLLSALSGACCAHRFPRPEGPVPSPAAFEARMAERAARIQSFEMITRIQFAGDGERLKGKVEILGKKPAALRFEALTPSDDTLALLATDGQRFMSHERGAPRCLTGPACAENVGRLVPIALPPHALFDALTGGVFASDGPTELSWDDCEGSWLLERRHLDQVQRAWVRPDTFGAVRVQLLRGDATALLINYSDEAETDGILLPRTVTVEAPERDLELEISISEAFLNGSPEDSAFTPDCPIGTTREELRCENP